MTVAAAAILILWIWALVQTPLNLALIPRLQLRVGRREQRVSVIIPARNEERAIEHTCVRCSRRPIPISN